MANLTFSVLILTKHKREISYILTLSVPVVLPPQDLLLLCCFSGLLPSLLPSLLSGWLAGVGVCCMSEMASLEWGKMAPRMKEAVCIHTTTESETEGRDPNEMG